MPSANELIGHGREAIEIRDMIKADGLIYQDLDDLVAAVGEENTSIKRFETSVFSGEYVTGDVNQEYLDKLHAARNDTARAEREGSEDANLELHNDND
jgi:amidophosphoribosyltransferase